MWTVLMPLVQKLAHDMLRTGTHTVMQTECLLMMKLATWPGVLGGRSQFSARNSLILLVMLYDSSCLG